jgi:outer membrane receptor protein involved in Fe transport
VSPEAIEYLAAPVFSKGTTDQTVFSGYVAANLDSYGIRSPFADTGVDLVLGLEYREENLDFKPDANSRSGDVSGQLTAVFPLKGGFDVTEIYTELSLPLVEGKPWADSLTLDLGYRYSDYSTDQDTDTYKVAASWSPVEELRLRASFQHAVRVPNIEELFDPQQGSSFGLPAPGDPCAGMSPASSLSDCLATGVTVEQYGSIPVSEARGYNSLVGGNTALAPEESDTRSIGFLYWPSFIEGLSISADWYEIEIDDAINNANPLTTLFNCLDSADPFFCDKIHRNPERGDLWIGDIDDGAGFIDGVNDNISRFSTSGYDVVLDYSFDIGSAGSMTVHNIFTYVDKWEREEVSGEPALECQGEWSFFCDAIIPEIRNNLRLTWLTPWNLTISGLWRHIDGVDAQNTNFAEDLDEVDYLDLAALWTINDNLTLRAGINNVFDEEPPLATGFIQGRDGNTLPNLYDPLGQYWFAGVSVRF